MAVVWYVLYDFMGIWLVLNWPFHPMQFEGWWLISSTIAQQAGWIHRAVLALLLVDVVSILTDKNLRSRRKLVATACAMVVIWLALISTEHMKDAIPPNDQWQRTVVYEFLYDAETQKFWLVQDD